MSSLTYAYNVCVVKKTVQGSDHWGWPWCENNAGTCKNIAKNAQVDLLLLCRVCDMVLRSMSLKRLQKSRL